MPRLYRGSLRAGRWGGEWGTNPQRLKFRLKYYFYFWGGENDIIPLLLPPPPPPPPLASSTPRSHLPLPSPEETRGKQRKSGRPAALRSAAVPPAPPGPPLAVTCAAPRSPQRSSRLLWPRSREAAGRAPGAPRPRFLRGERGGRGRVRRWEWGGGGGGGNGTSPPRLPSRCRPGECPPSVVGAAVPLYLPVRCPPPASRALGGLSWLSPGGAVAGRCPPPSAAAPFPALPTARTPLGAVGGGGSSGLPTPPARR